jgi:hypothetical protein
MQMSNRSWWLGALLAIAAGCGSTQSNPRTAAGGPPAPRGPAGGGMCPMMMEAQIVASDTNDGAAIAFTTTGDVAGLRMRVRRMADMRNRMAGGMMGTSEGDGMRGGGDAGMRGGGMQRGGGMMQDAVPARASVEDIPGGARLVLIPADPARLATLREQTHAQVAMMQRGECPMMQSPPAPDEPKQQPPQPDEDHEQHHPAGA